MKLDMTGRQIEITTELREFTEKQLRKLEKLLDGPLEVHVVLGVEKHRHLAEIQVKGRTAVLAGMEETPDLYASIREVAAKLERQALKHKEKVTLRKRREGTRAPDVAAVLEAENTLAEGASSGAGDDEPTRVVRSERYHVKPLSVEDALLELEGSGEDILVFRGGRNDQIRVLYRRRQGDFGLIEPEF